VNQAVDSDALMRHCRSFPVVSEEHPWGPGYTVFKVGGKGFAFAGDTEATRLTLKFDLGDAEALRLLYPGTVTVAPSLTRGGWCSVRIDGAVPDSELADADEYKWCWHQPPSACWQPFGHAVS
jgi:predicted DNA-binding protein (MmcQ/YjbR family)